MAEADHERNYEQMRKIRNRKQKKAGAWQSFGLDYPVFKGVERKGYRQPTPIQRKTIPLVIDGKDVVAMSRTGSGKTAAFVIPMLQKLKKRETTGMRALLIAPTRELALQTFKFVKELGRFTGLRAAVLVGGDSIENQFAVVHEKPDILIATPGRLLHLVVEMDLKLSTIQFFVLDEADRLFEMGFADQLHEVLKRLPESRQTLLFSATLPKILVDFAKAGLSDPVLVRLDVDERISDKLSMIFLICRSSDKLAAFLHLLRSVISPNEQTIVFCATMKHVEYISAVLQKAGIDCVFLYSQLDTVARKINIDKFREKKSRVLVVTDVAARGVDIPLLENAINFHFPPKAKLFVHRVGRVARAGQRGRSYSLVAADELPYLADLFLYLGKPLRFAQPSTVYKEDEHLVGTFPDYLIDLEIDFLKSALGDSFDMKDLLQKSENAMLKYTRTRPQPSAESIRRTKEELRKVVADAAIHPILRAQTDEAENVRYGLLTKLKNFKPSTTVFEFQSGSKAPSAAVMKSKRKAHQKYVKERSFEAVTVLNTLNNPVLSKANEIETAGAFQKVVGSTKFVPENIESKKPRKRKAEEILQEKEKHFIAYAPLDANAERALAVDRGFDAMAKVHTVEIYADDDMELYKQQKRKKWDRKLKKYVGDPGNDPSKKMIRTEEGTLLPASFKSGRYEKWQKKQQLAFREKQDDDSDEEEKEKKDSSKFASRGRGFNHHRGGGWKTRGVRGPRSELKTKEQIVKEKKKKLEVQDFQNVRRQENLRKKRGGVPSRGKRRR